jgi:hypothetical protein
LFSPLHQLQWLLSQVELAKRLVEAAIRFSRPWLLAFGSSLHGRMDAEFCLSCYTGYTPIRFNVHELCISVLFCHPTSLVIAELCICIF